MSTSCRAGGAVRTDPSVVFGLHVGWALAEPRRRGARTPRMLGTQFGTIYAPGSSGTLEPVGDHRDERARADPTRRNAPAAVVRVADRSCVPDDLGGVPGDRARLRLPDPGVSGTPSDDGPQREPAPRRRPRRAILTDVSIRSERAACPPKCRTCSSRSTPRGAVARYSSAATFTPGTSSLTR